MKFINRLYSGEDQLPNTKNGQQSDEVENDHQNQEANAGDVPRLVFDEWQFPEKIVGGIDQIDNNQHRHEQRHELQKSLQHPALYVVFHPLEGIRAFVFLFYKRWIGYLRVCQCKTPICELNGNRRYYTRPIVLKNTISPVPHVLTRNHSDTRPNGCKGAVHVRLNLIFTQIDPKNNSYPIRNTANSELLVCHFISIGSGIFVAHPMLIACLPKPASDEISCVAHRRLA